MFQANLRLGWVYLPAATALLSALPLLGDGAAAYAAETSCTPSNVIVFANRVHIRCEETVGGIRFFAAPTSDAAHAARVLSVISTATVAARNVVIFYDPANTSGTAIGCAASDCRLIDAVGFWR